MLLVQPHFGLTVSVVARPALMLYQWVDGVDDAASAALVEPALKPTEAGIAGRQAEVLVRAAQEKHLLDASGGLDDVAPYRAYALHSKKVDQGQLEQYQLHQLCHRKCTVRRAGHGEDKIRHEGTNKR